MGAFRDLRKRKLSLRTLKLLVSVQLWLWFPLFYWWKTQDSRKIMDFAFHLQRLEFLYINLNFLCSSFLILKISTYY